MKRQIPLRIERAIIAFYKGLYTEIRAGRYLKVSHEMRQFAKKLEVSRSQAWAIVRRWKGIN